MEGDVLVYVVLCLLVYMLGMQLQLNQLNAKVKEAIRKLDVILNERLKEKKERTERSEPIIKDMQF
jgi:hypothetical protein